jgi:two-component system sensor histidine kinase/response regulator
MNCWPEITLLPIRGQRQRGMQATILFVEDNEELRENAAMVLELEGYVVRVARDGREALDMLDNGLLPNLIVSDIMMPRMNGHEFFQAVRKRSDLKAVPFIFLTARGSRQDISTGRLLGADDYLVKPFDPEEFLIAVQNKLQRVADLREQVAEDLNDARRVLVQLLSHELRTPLTYVTGGFALLAEELEAQQEQQASKDVRISLDLIQSGTQRLNRLAEQMVLYSEIISGFVAHQVRTSGEGLDLNHLVADALTLMDHLAQEHQITVRRIEAAEGTPIVYGLRDILVTALAEVIRNAIQYSPEGEEIEVITACEEGYGVLTVIDHGPGIHFEDQETIWEVLIQSGRHRTEQQGVGMGLPIVKGIIAAHNGDIFLYSTPGAGTEVSLRLPLSSNSETQA